MQDSSQYHPRIALVRAIFRLSSKGTGDDFVGYKDVAKVVGLDPLVIYQDLMWLSDGEYIRSGPLGWAVQPMGMQFVLSR